jgi:hypothetical protein
MSEKFKEKMFLILGDHSIDRIMTGSKIDRLLEEPKFKLNVIHEPLIIDHLSLIKPIPSPLSELDEHIMRRMYDWLAQKKQEGEFEIIPFNKLDLLKYHYIKRLPRKIKKKLKKNR